MGARLMRSAYSPNIKERRDFSCALFTAAGEMLAQAAHIPVHLGSMPLSVRAVLEAFPPADMRSGEVFVVNDPFHGGTHLPDITVVAPVCLPGEAVPRFFVANRAHHADIGGISPGSMPLARSIDEEGLRLLPQRLDPACIERICRASRTPLERRGDLQAQLAALQLGRERLGELCAAHGARASSAYGAALLDYSERCLQRALGLATGHAPGALHACFTDHLDGDGFAQFDTALRCRLTLESDRALIDLRDSDPQVAGPLNAVHAICVSAALYCFRCLAQRLLPETDIPENAGLLRCVEVLTKPGTVVAALPPAAVAGGNVETSQRLVDAILGALAQVLPQLIPAASGGSMNNVTIGAGGAGTDAGPPAGGTAAAFAYYETLACGAGGGPLRAGASAVHTHMTNTLNTPVEALEHAYPLQVVHYALRPGSGGGGRHPGGEGIARRYRALVSCTLTLLTERRRRAPWGLAGGADGAAGRNTLYRADGSRLDLGGKCSIELAPGDEVELETPGGGGWGH
jgi:N-methylhydantoinase B